MSVKDIDSIRVSGHQANVDSFAACLRGIMAYWERDIPYDCILGLSGVAFSPALDPEQPCPGLWMEVGSEIRMTFLGHALGFTVNPVLRTSDRGLTERVQRGMENGAVVLCRSGPCWGVVTQWHEHPPERELTAPEGAEELQCYCPGSPHYLLRPTRRSLSSCEALRSALGFAALIASTDSGREAPAFGGRFYEAWSEKLNHETFCPNCREEWRCAARMASRARGNQRAAIHFLNRAYDFLPPGARHESLRDAACTFAAMANLLAPYTGEELRSVWNNPDERKLYVHDVQRVVELHRDAARHLMRVTHAG
ncbi:MAG: hypothetical protein ACOC7T_04930 [Planctomycetota bacterium]